MKQSNVVRQIDPSEKEPYDAGNPEHVRAAKKKAEIVNDLRREGLRFIMSDRRGRAWMRHLLSEKLFTRVGATRPAPIMTGSSYTYYNVALAEAGALLAAELNTFCREDYLAMENEGDSNG